VDMLSVGRDRRLAVKGREDDQTSNLDRGNWHLQLLMEQRARERGYIEGGSSGLSEEYYLPEHSRDRRTNMSRTWGKKEKIYQKGSEMERVT